MKKSALRFWLCAACLLGAYLPSTLAASAGRWPSFLGACSQWQAEVEGTALFWLPITRTYQWGETGPISGNSQNRSSLSAGPTYRWGYRIGLQLAHRCRPWSLLVQYTDYTSSLANSISEGPFSFIFGFVPQNGVAATGRLFIHYWSLSTRVGYNLAPCCCFQPNLLWGFRYVWWKHVGMTIGETDASTDSFRGPNAARYQFQGPAAELGFGAKWQFSRCLQLEGHLLGLGLVSRWRDRTDAISEQQGFDEQFVKWGHNTTPSLGADLRLGLGWSCGWRCLTFTGSAGWELVYYLTPMTTRYFSGNVAYMPTYGFGGPYLALRIEI